MLYKNVIEKKLGFRRLSNAEVTSVAGGIEGPTIDVVGTPSDPWVTSVSPDDLYALGMFDMNAALFGHSGPDPFSGDGGGDGGTSDKSGEEEFDLQEQEVDFIEVNDDGELERAEDTLEQALEEVMLQGSSDWAVEYDETTGNFIAQATTFNEATGAYEQSILPFSNSSADEFLDEVEKQRERKTA